jgi:UDP-N-acetyl-D-glucosamine dehydrogenase
VSQLSRISELCDRHTRHDSVVGVIGLGYVGLPLLCAFNAKGFKTIGFDVDVTKVAALERGQSYIHHIPATVIAAMVKTGRFSATSDFSRLAEADAIIICVPTPLTKQREPDISYIVTTCDVIARYLRRDQLIVLESTTYPGTTREVMRPILEAGGLREGEDYFLAFSPEREDPGNIDYQTATIPKVVGGHSPAAAQIAVALYREIVSRVVLVSSADTAEAVKLTENIFRAVNIALVNELKIVFNRMNIDVWEVIEAAKTKPFGYMPFYPGPGLGGHCIPIDPFYLTWKAREFDVATRFIELAGEINTAMPSYVVQLTADGLNDRFGKALKSARLLIVGLAYKKNVADIRESPAFRLIDLLERRGALVDYYDPFVPEIPPTREHAALAGRRSIEWSGEVLSGYDAAVICTDHDKIDYDLLTNSCKMVVDTRNALERRKPGTATVIKA